MREQEGKHTFQTQMPSSTLLAKVEKGYKGEHFEYSPYHFPLDPEGIPLRGKPFAVFPLRLGGVVRVDVAHWGLQLQSSRTPFGGRMQVAAFAFAAAVEVKKAGGHPEAGNADRCHPSCFRLPPSRIPQPLCIPASPTPLP